MCYVNGNSGGGEEFYVQSGLAKCQSFWLIGQDRNIILWEQLKQQI